MRTGLKPYAMVFAFVFVLTIISACGNVTRKSVNVKSGASGSYKKIAVLPFYNISGRRNAGRMIANDFVTEIFLDGRYRAEEPGNILQFMIQENINVVGEMGIDRIKILGRRLGVDAVLVGIVEVFDDGARSTPRVSIIARLVESESGRIVWSDQTSKSGDDYIIAFGIGKVRSANALGQRLIKKMIKSIKW